MTDAEIIQNFIEKTKDNAIIWKRIVRATTDSRLNVMYKCSFVEEETIELAPNRYTDAVTFSTRYSYKLSFIDKNNFCYKSIAPLIGQIEHTYLSQLFDLVGKRIDNLDEKLSSFFGQKK